MNNGLWIDDFKKPMNIQGFQQVLTIWEEIRGITLSPEIEDEWFWSWDPKELC
jgi:hypothetical protein